MDGSPDLSELAAAGAFLTICEALARNRLGPTSGSTIA
jgi:hypothetical protein